jgi:riboflavin kinase / FMN adenylyltransferase
MTVARGPTELERRPRSIAIGTFDGVHRGHRRVVEAVAEAEGVPTVLTFEPHPRAVLGNRVELLSTLDRRVELLTEAGAEDVLVVEFTLDLARLSPEEFAVQYLRAIGVETVVAGEDFRFGHKRSGDLKLLERMGFDVRRVPELDGVSSSTIRQHVRDGHVEEAARLLGRPLEVDGVVVPGDARGGTLGYPTANLRVSPESIVPRHGIYAGSTLGHRAAISIGVNPHYGGSELRIEPYLLDFEGDLYGRRLVVELWTFLREEAAFESEQQLVEQIARDVEATRSAVRPSTGP